MITACESPISLPNMPGMLVRCRKCRTCIYHRQMEWKNRMVLEQFEKPYKARFLTFTFNQNSYVDDPRHVMNETQRTFKLLRRKGYKIRYFMAIERGSKKGRLHNHMILWSWKMAGDNQYNVMRDITKAWGNGYVKYEVLRGIGGMHYTAKYLLKDLGKHVDRNTGEERVCRNYTWSNKPRLGNPGLTRYEQLMREAHRQAPFTREQLPQNWFNMIFDGKLIKAYIPSSPYVKLVQESLGIPLGPDYTFLERPTDALEDFLASNRSWRDVDQIEDAVVERL